jgi:hypothetical protein
MDTNEIKIDIDSLPAETQKYILALAAQKNISPADAARLVLNYAAQQSA